MFKVLQNNYSQSISECRTASLVINYAVKFLNYIHFYILKINILPIFNFSNLFHKRNLSTNPSLIFKHSEINNLQNVVDLIKEGVILLDNEGIILSVNTFIENLSDFRKEELVGNHISFLLGNCGISHFSENWAKRDCPPQYFKVKCRKKDDSFFCAEMVLQKPKVGKSYYYMLNIHDISSQVEIENALKEKKAELDMLIYKISHDLRGPLTSIFGLINLASMQDISLKEMSKYIKLIDRSACKLDATIKELIFFNEISSRPSFYSKFDASDVIQQSIQEVAETEECKNVSFNVLMPQEVQICSDITLIRNILTNLITNSVKYQKTDAPSTFVNIRIQKLKNAIQIEVEDNGEGIAENVQDKVFNMFYRGNTKSQGSGLGLFLVKQSVEKLKGEIYLKSKLGEGTRFTVNLPLVNG